MDDSNNRCSLEEPLVDNNEQPVSLKEGNASFFATLFNALNAVLGSGIVLVPFALASGGWSSLILLIVVSISATYSSILIKRCMEVDSSLKTYSDIGEYAFGNIGKNLVSIVLFVDLYMVDVGFLILEGDNLHNLFPNVGITLFGMSIDGKSSFILIIALILLPTVLLDNLSVLAYISASGVVASVLILGSVFWVGAFDGIGFNAKGMSLFELRGIPTAISLFMLCYSSHPVMPALYTSMKRKHHFSKVLLLCFFMSTVIYVLIAVSGYLMFGPGVESQITLNLPTEKISSQIAIYTTLISPFAKYALILKPVVIATEAWFPIECRKKKHFKIVVRTILVVTQVMVALTLPFFGYLMSLVGALLSATAALAIPCLCYLKISSTNSRHGSLERPFIWGIVILSIVIVVFGTYTSLVNITREIMHQY